MRLHLVAALILQVLMVSAGLAQDEGKLQSDRGGKTQTPWVTPNKMLQVETGFGWQKKNKDEYTFEHPELLLKYGLFNKLELRTRIVAATETYRKYNIRQSGITPVEIGVKALLTQGGGVVPHTSFTAQFGIPKFASSDFEANQVFPALRLNMEHDVTDALDLETNVAAEWDGFDNDPSWHFAFSPHLELTEQWQLFVEAFGSMKKKEKGQISVDAGMLHWFGKNVMVDITAGTGLTKTAPDYFIDAGVSFRLR